MLKIQELRTSAGLTQRELAEQIGVKNYTVANWEQNRTEPSIKDLIDLANFFEVSVDYLIGRENELGQVVVFKNLSDCQKELLCTFETLNEEQKKLFYSLLQQFKSV